MGPEFDEDTLPPARRAVPVDPADIDADTLIRERKPFADLPPEVRPVPRPRTPAPLVEPPTRAHEPEPTRVPAPVPAVDLTATLPIEYSFAINKHDPIALDRPALIGRHPSLPRIMQGRPPRLVRVPSPLREVSGTHVELRQQGALVVITDLRSTNGSVIRVPGREPVKLLQGESVVVMPGTVVDIGDGNTVEVLPLTPTPPTDPTEGMPS